MKEIRAIIQFWEARRDRPLALATLVRVRGSSYRRPGARMLISENGESAGSLSAGCIEEEVIARAREIIVSGKPTLMSFDTRRRFGCNGRIEIFVERVSNDLTEELRERFNTRESCELMTVFETSESPLVISSEAERSRESSNFAPKTLGTRLADSFAQANGFVQRIAPSLRLIVVGDGPDVFAICTQASLLGWDAIAIEAITALREPLDDRTAIIVATHNFGRDCAALRFLLPSGLRYVGLIGPRRRRDEILLDVLDSGAEFNSQLFAPAGLHLAADSPEEIALSIVAEIQSVFTNATAERLRDRKAPIHDVAAAEWATSAR